MLRDADDLRLTVENIDQQILPVTAILSLDEISAELTQTNSNIDKLKADLRKIEDTQPHNLDQESLAHLRASEELAKSELDKLKLRCDSLQKQAELIGIFEDRQNDAANQARNLRAEVESFTEKYAHGPVALVNAEDDVRKSGNTQNRLSDAIAFLDDSKNIIARDMPSNEPALQQLDEQKNALNELSRTLNELRQPLAQEVAQEIDFLKKQSDLERLLTDLEEQALNASEKNEIEKIHASLQPIRDELEKLKNDVEQTPSNLVQHGDLLNLSAVDARIVNLEKVLNNAEESREKMEIEMKLAKLAGQIETEIKKIADELSRVQAREADPHSSPEELKKSIDILDSASNQLGTVEDLYNQLDTANDQQNAIRTQAVVHQTALGEALKNTRQALQDRIDALDRFNDGANDVEMRLRKLMDQINAVEPTEYGALEKLSTLTENEAKLAEDIEHLDEFISALSPLEQPLVRQEELRRLQRDLADQLNRSKIAAEAAVQKQQQIDEYVDKIEKLEDTLRGLEREADSVPLTTEFLRPLTDAIEANIFEPIKQLEKDREAPTDDLRERKSRLKANASNLKQRLNNDYKMAQNQENLLDDINRNLETTNAEIQNMKAKYQDQKLPLDEAIATKNSLEDLLVDRLSPVVASLDELDKNNRDEVSRKLEEVRSHINSLLAPISNETQSAGELLKDWRDALENINRIGAEVLTVGTSEDAQADLTKITALLDSLRPLKQKSEELDARKLSPTQFIQQPITDETSLKQRVTNLQDELANKRKMLTDRISLEAVVPEIQLVSESLQQRLDEFATPTDQLPVDVAENSIHELEEQKKRLESLLEKIPEGKKILLKFLLLIKKF